MRIPAGLRIDNPAHPLLLAGIAYWGYTSAAGNALGTTLVCADLDNHPTYVGNRVKVITEGSAGQDKAIQAHAAGGILTVDTAFTNAAGAVQQIAANTLFIILTNYGGGGGGGGMPPTTALWMFGIVSPTQVASTTVVTIAHLAGFQDNTFNDEFYMQMLDADGVAPEGEMRLITDYVGATGDFTVNAFSANVEAGDIVGIIHESLITLGGEVISVIIQAIFDLVAAELVLNETGGIVTSTGPGTEDNIYINNAPAGEFHPMVVTIDMSDLAAGETATVRVRKRINAAGALEIIGPPVIFAGVQAEPLKDIELQPNRFGCSVTIEGTAAVIYEWEIHLKD